MQSARAGLRAPGEGGCMAQSSRGPPQTSAVGRAASHRVRIPTDRRCPGAAAIHPLGFAWKAAPYRCASRACSGAGQPSPCPCSTLLPGKFPLQPLTPSMDESSSSSASLGASLRVWNRVRWEEERLKVLEKTLATGGNWDGPRGLLGWTKHLLKD